MFVLEGCRFCLASLTVDVYGVALYRIGFCTVNFMCFILVALTYSVDLLVSDFLFFDNVL